MVPEIHHRNIAQEAGRDAMTRMEHERPDRWRCEPSSREVILLSLMSFVIFVIVVASLDNYWERASQSGDNPMYIAISAAIRRFSFNGVDAMHFWGLSYAIAALSALTTISDLTALLVISLVSSLITTVFINRLWGGWVASFFGIISWDWIQRSSLGGAEPLFMALLCGTFLAVRTERWTLAALSAACATTVRPVGVFALLAIAIVLLFHRNWGRLAIATSVGAAVGLLYVLPIAVAFGDPLANINNYRSIAWGGGSPVTFPGLSMIQGLMSSTQPLTNTIKILVWVSFVLAGIAAMITTKQYRAFAAKYPVETVFVALYLLFLFAYNSPGWSWAEFPRFAIPAAPLVLVALSHWAPRDRRLLWIAGVCSASIAGASAINVRHAFDAIRHIFHA